MSTPTGLLATSGLELLTWSTPNGAILPHHPLQPATPTNPEVVFHPTGYKISIFLEELHAAYGVAYTWQAIDLTRGVQKEAWYTALHPNGKIPCLVDHERGGRAIMEGQAILQYLCRAYDRDARFHFRDDPERAECEQWMGFAQSHLGPQAGEANLCVLCPPLPVPCTPRLTRASGPATTASPPTATSSPCTAP